MSDGREAATIGALQRDEARWLRVLWCDNANVIRLKALHLPSARLHASGPALVARLERGLTISQALQALPVMRDAPVADAQLPPTREIRLVPDWPTLYAPPHTPGHCDVMANFISDGAPWALCPRDFLRRMERRGSAAGLAFQIGVEIEFFLLQSDTADGAAPRPVDHDVYAAASAHATSRAVIDEVTDNLWRSGIALAGYNPESGPGQHEISLAHASPLVIADRLVAARDIIRAVALRHARSVTFLPKLFADATGSGAHLHLSLWADGRNVTADAQQPFGLDARARHFIAGLMTHLAALTALTTPTPSSFRRLQPQTWSGAFTAWGIGNKEAAVRVLIDREAASAARFELKTVDLSANPYIAIGAVLAAGLDGIATAQRLGDPIDVTPDALSESERRHLGIARLPADLAAALAALAGDAVLCDALGADLARVYAAVRRAEHDALHGESLERERALLLTRY